MPKPSSLLDEREREICDRVHIVRTEIVKWSQPDLARELGITQNQLAGLEYARSPLRYVTARTLCDKCHVSQRWLATGNLPIRVFIEVHISRERVIPLDALFSQAYDEFLAELIEAELADLAKGNHCKITDLDKHRRRIGMRWPVGTPGGDRVRIYHERLLDWRLNKLPPDEQIEIFKKLNEVLNQLLPGVGVLEKAEASHAKASTNNFLHGKDSLDKGNDLKDDERVKKIVSLSDLIAKLREKTKMRGQKAALARELKITRQAVDQWLSGNSKPTAETTLKLLHWVEQQ